MKRRALLAHLHSHGCALLREGGAHSWWCHTATKRRSAVPRHGEISDVLAIKICRDLGIAEPTKF